MKDVMVHDESVNTAVILATNILQLPWGAKESAILNPDEIRRMKRFVFERDRMHFGRVRAWLRTVIGSMLSIEPAAIHLRYNLYGKPHLCSTFNLHFNISHSDNIALLALSRHPVGVDVEHVQQNHSMDLIACKQFTPTEQRALRSVSREERNARFITIWTRKEAVVKGMGCGLSVCLSDIDTGMPTTAPAMVLGANQMSTAWYVRTVPVLPTQLASIATPWKEGKLFLCWPGTYSHSNLLQMLDHCGTTSPPKSLCLS